MLLPRSQPLILMLVGDWNGHIRTPAGVFSDTHSGHGFGTCNTEGQRILEFANGPWVGNTWFKKKDTHLITYSSSGDSTQLDYIVYHDSFSSAVSYVKVIPIKECIRQHHMVVCDFTANIPHVKKCMFSLHIQTWNRRDPATASQFQCAFMVTRNCSKLRKIHYGQGPISLMINPSEFKFFGQFVLLWFKFSPCQLMSLQFLHMISMTQDLYMLSRHAQNLFWWPENEIRQNEILITLEMCIAVMS